MLLRIVLALCLLVCAPAWCQVTTTDAEADKTSDADTLLLVPPPVSGRAFATTFSGETQSNFLSGGVTFTGAYSSNVSYGSTPVSDMSYSLWPTIELDKTTFRMHFVLDYAPGFTFYQRLTSLNQANQNVGMSFQYQLSPNITATVREGLRKTSNAFDQPNPLSATPVSGAYPVSNIAIIVPAADMLNNTTGAQLTYQVSGDSMIGGGGNYSLLNYSDQANNSGLFNSRSVGGSLFYSTKIHEKNYLGVSYQYENSLSFQTDQPSTLTQTQTIFLFYSMILKPNLSVSISGGPQHYSSVQSTLPAAASWQPMTMVSVNWQGERTSVAASYARAVGGGGGLNGTFHSNNAGMSLLWRASRNWTTGLSGNYTNFDNLTPLFISSSPGGHTLSGTASLQRTLKEHTNIQFGYNWAHQSYPGLQTVSNNPNINRVFVTISFTFTKPLQR
jgi:hypothetical protein